MNAPRKALHEKNQARINAHAKTGTPIQINGLEIHMLQFLITHALGEEAIEECLLQWEQSVDGILDNVDSQVRQQQLLQGVAGMPQQPPPNGALPR